MLGRHLQAAQSLARTVAGPLRVVAGRNWQRQHCLVGPDQWAALRMPARCPGERVARRVGERRAGWMRNEWAARTAVVWRWLGLPCAVRQI